MEIINRQRKKRQNTLIATICHETITKIVTFITSILIGNVFPSFKIWLPQVMASLSRKPQLLGSLQQLLTTFKFGNIYNITRKSSHATLRMAFQIQLPIDIRNGPEEIIELTADTPLFGLLDLKNINGELSYKRDFDAENVKQNISFKLDYGFLGPTSNVAILEPGTNPNLDEEILHTAEMYKNEFALKDDNFLDIVADEAIYR
ncbi:hypothetical protein GLOIN_2v1482460 [Rhizophagus clarus]|uniref:Uncharacterized protein n=1 Tax=Rhizophagus clarus TaxID=94130 RepID=A0A8H3MCJ0_9GLOM|nr:hypothetical protein GLOIN_2v1482460 [Rhizophagus clarus]